MTKYYKIYQGGLPLKKESKQIYLFDFSKQEFMEIDEVTETKNEVNGDKKEKAQLELKIESVQLSLFWKII